MLPLTIKEGEMRMSTAMDRRNLLKFGVAATAALGASTLPTLARAAAPASGPMIEPGAGSWRTWFLGAGSDLRLPAPPDSAGEVGQVRAMVGQVDAAQLDRITYWDAGAPPYRWNEIATGMAFKGSFGSGNYPRIQAYFDLAIHDPATWDGKIPEGPGLWKGQNPVGVTDRFWKPLIVPSADVLRAPPPPAWDSPQRAQEIDAVTNFPRTPGSNGLAIWVQYQLRGSPNFHIYYNRELSRRVFGEHPD